MRRTRNVLSLIIAMSFLGASLTSGQTVIRHGGGDEGDADILLLTELGVVVGLQEGSTDLKVMMLLPDANPDADIKRDDLLLMINGKRVKDMDSLRAEYEAAAVGDELKLGFRRGDRRFLSSFEKEDPEMPEGATRMVMIGGPGGDAGEMQPLQEFGVLLGEKDGKVVVLMELPMDGTALQEDDVVQTVNGTAVSSVEEFRGLYEPLAIGDALDIVAVRDGEEISVSRAKAESQGQVRVRQGP